MSGAQKRKSSPVARASGHKPQKRQRQSGADALFAMSQAMESMTGGLASGSAAGPLDVPHTSPELMQRAIKLIEGEEDDDEAVLLAIDLFQRDTSLTTTYLGFGRPVLQKKWLQCQIAADIASKQFDFHLFPLSFKCHR
jgi:hypothetical protein